MAMGNSSSCIRDEWSVLNNIGALASVTQTTAGFSQYAVPSFKPFNRMAATIVIPAKIGNLGAAIFRFGDALYNEQMITLGYSNKFGLASLGLKVNYIQYNAAGFGRSGNVTVSFGGVAEITPRFLVGATIENINQPKLSDQSDQRVTSRFIVGTGYKLGEKVFAITELEKDLENSPIIKAGIQYDVHKKFTARTGLNLNPQAAFGGFGFKLKKFKLDYALQFHEYIGAAHQASVVVTPGKNK